MCYLGAIIKLKNEGLKDTGIFDGLSQAMSANADGYSIIGFNDKNKITINKTLDINLAKEKTKFALDYLPLSLYHFRFATSGAKDVNNLHFWQKGKKGRWLFAHNGFITSLDKDKSATDSLCFYRLLVKELKGKENKPKQIANVLNELSDGYNLSGRFLLLDLVNRYIYTYGDFTCYYIPDRAVIITNHEFNLRPKVSFGKLNFSAVSKTTIDGINLIKLASSTRPLEMLTLLEPVETTSTSYYYKGGSNYAYDDYYKNNSYGESYYNYPSAKRLPKDDDAKGWNDIQSLLTPLD